jgi:hypothetical protein
MGRGERGPFDYGGKAAFAQNDNRENLWAKQDRPLARPAAHLTAG